MPWKRSFATRESLAVRGNGVGGSTVLVQTGDVIDRGPDSVGAYKLLEKLQIEALRTGGAVVRLLGNHELEFLQGRYYLTNIVDRRSFRRMLRDDVLAGKVQGAYAGQGYLFTHAGVRSEIQQCLLQGQQVDRAEDSAQVLAESVNRILIEALKAEDFSHPIFRIGENRGGDYPVGGIFWTRGVFPSLKASQVPQVFGHTPEHHIRRSPSERRVDIDVGIHCYGGRAYLTLLDGKPTAHKVTSSRQHSAP